MLCDGMVRAPPLNKAMNQMKYFLGCLVHRKLFDKNVFVWDPIWSGTSHQSLPICNAKFGSKEQCYWYHIHFGWEMYLKGFQLVYLLNIATTILNIATTILSSIDIVKFVW